MSLNRWNARRDANERPIVRALRQAGAQVLLLDDFDLLVWYRKRLSMLDPKTRHGRPTKGQQALIDAGWPLQFVEDEMAALRAIGAI